jgi:hypothetical protein
MKASRLFLSSCVAFAAMAVVASAAQRPEKVVVGKVAKQPENRAAAGTVLWDQNQSPTANGISSQDFEAIYDAYDDMAAADFIVPAATSWSVTGAFVPGAYFPGSPGPTPLANVIFFNNSGSNTPGTPVCTYTGLVAGVDYTDTAGTLDITFPSPCVLSGAPTTYWMEVQADMDAGVGGQWGWTVHATNPAPTFVGKWQNPGGGFGVCPQWGDLLTCIPTAGGPDYAFQIIGQIVPVELQHFSIE